MKTIFSMTWTWYHFQNLDRLDELDLSIRICWFQTFYHMGHIIWPLWYGSFDMGHMMLLIIVLNKSIESNRICKFENDLLVPNVPNMTNSSSRMVNFNFQIRDSSSWIDLFESTSMHDLTKQTSITKGLVQNCEKHYWNSILNLQYFTLCHEPINYASFHSQFHIILVQLVKKSIIGDPC